jgi:predicted Rossmann fold nucleotide-binding protein DprA/Smf involved in DNA uptake
LYSELEKERKSKGKKQKVKEVSLKGEVDLKSEERPSFKPPILSSVNCSENGKKILSAFSEKIMMSDLLSSRSGVMGASFIAAITELELKGYIKAVPVGRYELKI